MTDKKPLIFFSQSGTLSVSEIYNVQISSGMKVCEVIKILEADGWYLARTKGSHRQFKHTDKAGTVTVSGKSSVDVPIGTLKSIWRQAQLEVD
jgi:predicted RNA binding protein YcfA (HicA-like mRNA interferase family)